MNTVFLMLGSNMGDKADNLRQVTEMISQRIGPVIRASSLYETEPWGFSHPEKFLNQCLQVRSSRSPGELLSLISDMEGSMGREKDKSAYQARVIDVDILFYNNQVVETDDLIIPHPLIGRRRFVLVPLSEIAPRLIHPVSGKAVSEMLETCDDQLSVIKVRQG